MKRFLHCLVVTSIILSFFTSVLFFDKPEAEAAYSYNYRNLASDEGFVRYTALNVQGIQNILNSTGGFLAGFSEGGRSAAQIIYDAANNSHINPIAILATLQKEQSLVYAKDYSQYGVDWAMGYGVCDSCSVNDPKVIKYRGFTKQVDSGAWQLRYNYDYWAVVYSEWKVGRIMNIDGVSVKFANRCTSSLYRYTPHLGGNQNFAYYFDKWGGNGYYSAKYAGSQGPYKGPGSYGSTILPTQRFTVWVNYRNDGPNTWYRSGSMAAKLGLSSPRDRGSAFTGWHNVRGSLVQYSVPPGGIGTFTMALRAPTQAGNYVEKMQPLIETVGWIGQETVWYFNVTDAAYKAQLVTQGPYSGPGAYGVPMKKGQSFTIWVNYRNTGLATWYRKGSYPTYLGMINPRDRASVFTYGRGARGRLVQYSVPPGGIGTFQITMKAPSTAGWYTEIFSPLTEGITWMNAPAVWYFHVK